ncbi:MAG: hypothetical protein ABI639_05415 [Thermoanaerobaculia bacterium]
MSRFAGICRGVDMIEKSLLPLTSAALILGSLVAATPGGAVGLSAVRAQAFENEHLFFYEPEQGDLFGYALATGDFNGDGADDLATGIPLDDGLFGSPTPDMGAVVVRYGIPGRGLATGVADTWLSQSQTGSPSPPHAGERFGWSLAAGDFDNDGIDDLAIGIPRDHNAFDYEAGAVEIHYGLPGGIQLAAGEYIQQGTSGVPGNGFNLERFGEALAVGDFNGDGPNDLAIGAPGDYLSSAYVGSVTVLHGSPAGLLPYDGYRIVQGDSGLPDVPENGDDFGAALATGDFNGDYISDLAIGAPGEDDVGAVLVLFGSPFSLLFADRVWWGQGDLGGTNESGDRFGQALVSGNFDSDAYDDLVIGAPFEDLGAGNSIVDAGEFTLLYGSGAGAPNWFNLARTSHFRQSDIFLDAGADHTGDRFGWAFAAGDFDHDGNDDLAVGHPGEDFSEWIDAGAVTILMGASGTGTWNGADLFVTTLGQLPGSIQSSQDLGRSLATGDFDGDGHADLAIGAPYYDVPGGPWVLDVGRENVLYGTLFSDGFFYGSAILWSAASP